MNSHGTTRCPHCGAIATATICGICGRSAYEEITPPEPRRRLRWWQQIDRGTALRQTFVLGGIVIFAAVTAYILTRPDPPPDPAALPTPDETALTTSTTTPGQAPSVDRGSSAPTPTVPLPDPGVGRDVGPGLSPWEEAPPIDFVTGQFLDETADYRTDIARVGELLGTFPRVLMLEELDDPELLTFGGPIDLDVTEQTQPFAARVLSSPVTGEIGELWLIASGGSPDGDAYLASARARWDTTAAVEEFAPAPGLRLWKLGEDDVHQMWVTDLTEDSLAIVQVPLGVAPTALANAIEAWRSNARR